MRNAGTPSHEQKGAAALSAVAAAANAAAADPKPSSRYKFLLSLAFLSLGAHFFFAVALARDTTAHYHALTRTTTHYQKNKHHPIKADPQPLATGCHQRASSGIATVTNGVLSPKCACE
jgi:hypothetical protein